MITKEQLAQSHRMIQDTLKKINAPFDTHIMLHQALSQMKALAEIGIDHQPGEEKTPVKRDAIKGV